MSILKKYPGTELTAGVKMWFGEYYYNRGLLKEAKDHFKLVISQYPRSGFVDDAFYWLAWTLYEEGKPDRAISEFKALYKNYPESEWAKEALVRAGDILLEQGKPDEALSEFKSVIEDFKDSSFTGTANRKIGRILMDKKKFIEAIEYLKNAQTIEDTDFNAQIQYDIAEAYELKGDPESAVTEYLKVSYMYPESTFWAAKAEAKCGGLLEGAQEWGQAINVYDRLAKRGVKESEHAIERLEWLKLKNTRN